MLNLTKIIELEDPAILDNVAETQNKERLPSSFRHGDEKMKAKMVKQTADFTALLVAFVARLRSQYGVNMVKSVATWSKVNILAVSKDMDPKTWK